MQYTVWLDHFNNQFILLGAINNIVEKVYKKGRQIWVYNKMKTLKQRFHQQKVRQYKSEYFSKARKQLHEMQSFHWQFNRAIENRLSLNTLVERLGWTVVERHLGEVLLERVYRQLYEDEYYFVLNLSFIRRLVEEKLFPQVEIGMLVRGMGEVLGKYGDKLSAEDVEEIFSIVEEILGETGYRDNVSEILREEQLIRKLYETTVTKERNFHLIRVIRICHLIKDQTVTGLSNKEMIGCLQIHVLTNSCPGELSFSYRVLAEMFSKTYNSDDELFEYGSIVDKAVRDFSILNNQLIEAVCHFLQVAIENNTIKKVIVQMGHFPTIFYVLLDALSIEKHYFYSQASVQSMFNIFNKISQYLLKEKKLHFYVNLQWKLLKQKLQNSHQIKRLFFKSELFQYIRQLSITKQTHFHPFGEFQLTYAFGEFQLNKGKYF